MKFKKLFSKSKVEKESNSRPMSKPHVNFKSKLKNLKNSVKEKTVNKDNKSKRKDAVYNLLEEQCIERELVAKVNKKSKKNKNKMAEDANNENLNTQTSKIDAQNDEENHPEKATVNDVKKKKRSKKSGTQNTLKSQMNKSEVHVSGDDDVNTSVNEPLLSETSDSRDSRTIFIGNLPVNFNKKKLMKLLKEHGNVEKMWTRGAKPLSAKLPKKVAVNKNLLPEDHPPLMVYALFKTSIDARNALKMNGLVFEDHRLRVTSSREKVHAPNKGVFIGNLPFNIKDDELYNMFDQCGEIVSVRVVRDPRNGIGKGFGYVNFQSADSVELALNLNEEKLNGREIRVSRLFSERKKKKIDKKKKMQSVTPHENVSARSSVKQKKVKKLIKPDSNEKFCKKKPKLTATDRKKKLLAEKLTVKPRKKKNEVLI